MRKLFFLALTISQIALGQSIDVDPIGVPESNYSPQELIELVFLNSDVCPTEVTNVIAQYGQQAQNIPSDVPQSPTIYGDSYGYFVNSNPNFPLNEGIILSTGIAHTAEGHNSGTGTAGFENPSYPWSGSSDLEEILDVFFGNSAPVREATSFAFDFVANGDEISFDYVFASEEWNASTSGYECPNTSDYLDGFAFIITGPGIIPDTYDHDNNTGTPEIQFAHGGKNIALIPGTNIPVSAGTIYDNVICVPTQSNPDLHILNPAPSWSNASPVEFNAMTVGLNAESNVIPGESYNIKIIVGDRSDDNLDSAVFLKADSFTAGTPIINGNNIICTNEISTLTVSGSFGSLASFVWYNNGVEIPGENTSSINVSEEGTYSVELIIAGCNLGSDTFVVTFFTGPNAGDNGATSLCSDDSLIDLFNLLGNSPDTGGIWSPSLSSGTGIFDPLLDSEGTYMYTVSGLGSCGDDTSEVMVSINLGESFLVTLFDSNCGIPEGVIEISGLSSNSNYNVNYTFDGSDNVSLTFITNDNGDIIIDNLSSGVYSDFYIELVGGCGVNNSNQYVLEELIFDPSITFLEPSLCNSNDGIITFSDLIAGEEYQLTYEYNDQTNGGDMIIADLNGEIILNNLSTGVYSEFLLNIGPCSEFISEYIEFETCGIIPQGISPNNDNINDSFEISWLGATNINIYNRYGVKLYEKADYRNEWYGDSDDGHELPTATYFYVISISDGAPITGWVYINREN